MKVFNPVAFFISLQMSLLMALIFAVPSGMPFWLCVELWPVRWSVAYFFANFICNPLGFALAVKVFKFNPQDKTGLWNPVSFFISLQMSFIVPLIFGVTTNLPFDRFLLLWPLRWAVAYCLINFIVRSVAFRLAAKVFSFTPQGQ